MTEYFYLNGMMYPEQDLENIAINESDCLERLEQEFSHHDTGQMGYAKSKINIKSCQENIKKYVSYPNFDPEHFSGLNKGILRGMLEDKIDAKI